jgi:hypothetical protein
MIRRSGRERLRRSPHVRTNPGEGMRRAFVLLILIAAFPAYAGEFGIPENILNDYRAVRHESVYTKVPTTGKLVSVKITDSGRVFYVCRERTGYVIYSLEIRPIAGFEEKVREELKNSGRNWNADHPNELLYTKDFADAQIRRRLSKYTEAVWVRNEIVVPEAQKQKDRE